MINHFFYQSFYVSFWFYWVWGIVGLVVEVFNKWVIARHYVRFHAIRIRGPIGR